MFAQPQFAPHTARAAELAFAFRDSLDAMNENLHSRNFLPGPTCDNDGWQEAAEKPVRFRPTDADTLPPAGLPVAEITPLPARTPGQIYWEAAFGDVCGGWESLMPALRENVERGAEAVIRSTFKEVAS